MILQNSCMGYEPNFTDHVTWWWPSRCHFIISSVLFILGSTVCLQNKNCIAYSYREIMMGLFVLLLLPCELPPLCSKRDSCYYPDTKPRDVPFLDIIKQDIYPRSCAAMCMLNYCCVGVTYDPLDETCHLYKQSASFGIKQAPGVSLWLFQAPGVPCFKASQQQKQIKFLGFNFLARSNSFADLSSSRATFCRHCGLQSTLKISLQFSEINNTKTYQRATTNNRYYCIQLWTAERKKWNWTGKYDVFYFHHMPRTHAEMDRIINITFHFQNVHLSGMYSSI